MVVQCGGLAAETWWFVVVERRVWSVWGFYSGVEVLTGLLSEVLKLTFFTNLDLFSWLVC